MPEECKRCGHERKDHRARICLGLYMIVGGYSPDGKITAQEESCDCHGFVRETPAPSEN